MKNCIGILSLAFWMTGCSLEISYPETLEYSPKEGENLIEIQKQMARELYEFYRKNKDKKYEFYEIQVRKAHLLLNYCPDTESLCISYDLCSGLTFYFVQVDEATLKKLADARLPFDGYRRLLAREEDTKKWGKTKTHACGNSYYEH
jgi:hypothetical protein